MFEEKNHLLDEESYDHVLDHLIGLKNDIYESGCIDDIEFHLEEILHVFGLKIPQKNPKICKKEEKNNTQVVLNQWLEYNNEYNFSLMKNKKQG